MTYAVIFSASAKADLFAIYDYIAEHANGEVALNFIDSIEAYCHGFAQMPNRGIKRDDLRRGLRSVGFRKRATILFQVNRAMRQVIIHGIYYAGRNWQNAD